MSKTILAIETATSACSVALKSGDQVFADQQTGNNIHSQVLLPMVESLLDQAQVNRSELDAVAVGQGPGSFTGLRIGIGVAQGLAYGAGCPMIGVSSLAALAQQALTQNPESDRVLAAIDARMGELYFGAFDRGSNGPKLIGDVLVIAPELLDATLLTKKTALAGNAWSEYQARLSKEFEALPKPSETCVLPDAAALLGLAQAEFAEGRYIDPRQFEPDYVRNNVAKVKAP